MYSTQLINEEVNLHFSNKRAKIGHLGILTECCLKYAIEFDTIIKSVPSTPPPLLYPIINLQSSQSSSNSHIITSNKSNFSSSSISPSVSFKKKEKFLRKSEKMRINEEISKKKLKLENLNKKLERKLELIKQTKKNYNVLNLKKNYKEFKNQNTFKPPVQSPIKVPINNEAELFKADQFSYYQAKSLIENLMLISSAPTNNFLSNSLQSPPINLCPTGIVNSKPKRFNPYDVNLRPTHKQNQFQNLINNTSTKAIYKHFKN